jgi:glycosyltransferase involved in cell wall biosynthesis
MSGDLLVSVIICTRNRATGLKRTLETLERNRVPPGWQIEVTVVDNASTDGTAQMLRDARIRNGTLDYVHEAKPGLSNARNAGLARARGEIILFTDDDVLLDPDWMERLASPLANGICDAVTGQVTLAEHLIRPWMGPMHRLWLACSDDVPLHEGGRELIGANMGFRRPVLERVPAFDPELGAGALGLAEETLFGWQLSRAGFKIEYVPSARLVHELDASRLRRDGWLDAARKRGRSRAYLDYHWEHADMRAPGLRSLVYLAKLQLRRRWQRPPPLQSEGCHAWEMSYIRQMETCRQFSFESRRGRNYSYRGLAKRGALGNLRPQPAPLENQNA